MDTIFNPEFYANFISKFDDFRYPGNKKNLEKSRVDQGFLTIFQWSLRLDFHQTIIKKVSFGEPIFDPKNDKKSSKNLSKTYHEILISFWSILDRFWSHLGTKLAPKMAPSGALGGSQDSPEPPNTLPGQSQDSPRLSGTLRDAPGTLPGPSRAPPGPLPGPSWAPPGPLPGLSRAPPRTFPGFSRDSFLIRSWAILDHFCNHCLTSNSSHQISKPPVSKPPIYGEAECAERLNK